jgi:hypothetical protein
MSDFQVILWVIIGGAIKSYFDFRRIIRQPRSDIPPTWFRTYGDLFVMPFIAAIIALALKQGTVTFTVPAALAFGVYNDLAIDALKHYVPTTHQNLD